MTPTERDRQMLIELARATGLTLTQISRDAGVAVTTLTRLANQKTGHRLSLPTLEKLRTAFPDFFGEVDEAPTVESAYAEVDVLPSFAGMGGGGTGEGEPGVALVPRRLIEERLKAQPRDLLLIDVRGDSMTPDFEHGDQILVDKRDCDPRQPGPFALWDGDGYVVKLVEKAAGKPGTLRIFSANRRYSDYELPSDEARIMGRAVWFSRAL